MCIENRILHQSFIIPDLIFDMTNSIRNLIISSLIIGVVSGGLSGFGVYIYQNQIQQDEITELKNQNVILSDTQVEQHKQTQIMNNTLYRWIDNLEKKSQISVLVRFEDTKFYSGSFGGTFGGGEYTLDTQAILHPIEFSRNQTANVEIILTNIGDDTAVIESFSVNYYHVDNYGSSFGFLKGETIDIILKPNSEPQCILFFRCKQFTYGRRSCIYNFSQ